MSAITAKASRKMKKYAVLTREPRCFLGSFDFSWEQRKLGELVDVCSGRDYKHLSEGTIPVYGTGGYMLSVNDALSYDRDAIGIGRKGTIDRPYILKAPFWTVDTLFYAIPREKVDLNYAFDIFQNIDWKKKDESTGVPSLSKTAINDIDVLAPKHDEQQIIGQFFAAIDNLITLHQRECISFTARAGRLILTANKKRNTSSWEQRKLGEVATFINGRAYSQPELLSSGKYKVLRVGNFYTNDSWYYSDLELGEKYYADYGDLLYTWSATFGPHIWLGDRVIYHYHIWKINLSDQLEKQFAVQLLEQDRANILSSKNGSTMVHITKEGMEQKDVIIPPSTKEQQEIGAFFLQLDNLITLHQRKPFLMKWRTSDANRNQTNRLVL